MKNLLLLLLFAVIPIGVEASTPYIFHVTKTATANDVVGIQGDQFGSNPTVWIDRLEIGDTVANPEVQLTNILTSSNNYIAVKLPNNLTLGVYAIFVRSGSIDSSPALVNQAGGWHYLDLAGREIVSGTTFRISGRNLAFTGHTPQVRFVRKTGGLTLNATGVASSTDRHIITCTVPSGMTATEEYHVEVNNGMSDLSTIWTRVPGKPLLVRSGTGDPFAIGVPWGADFNTISTSIYDVTTYGAAGNGTTNDQAAIQSAINAASAAGGGTVYFPAGTYKVGVNHISGIDFHLYMLSNVVLKGAGVSSGVHLSKIVSEGNPVTPNAGLIYVPPGIQKIGFSNLEFYGDQYCSIGINYPVALRAFMIGCRVESDGPAGSQSIAWREGYESVIKDSTFISNHQKSRAAYFGRQDDLIIKNCRFEYHDDRIDFVEGERVQMEDCTIARSTNSDGLNGPEYGGLVTPAFDFTLLNTDFIRLESSGAIPRANDGESVLCEYISTFKALSKADSSTTNTLTDLSASWTTNDLIDHEITIIRGPGVGQRRLITGNTATMLTVASAWDILPTSASRFSVNKRFGRHLIYGCDFNNVPRGIWYYRTPFDDLTIASNTFQDTGSPIWLRANQRVTSTGYGSDHEFNTMTAIMVEDNAVLQTSNYLYVAVPPFIAPEYTAFVADSQVVNGTEIHGGLYYDTVFRGNALVGVNNTTVGGIHVALGNMPIVDNTNASAVGIIVQGNYLQWVLNGVGISTGNHQTVIWDNVFVGVGQNVNDVQLPSHSHPSVGTVISP